MFKNSFARCEDGSALIYLTQGRICLIDQDDLLNVLQHNWHAVRDIRTFYAATNANGRKLRMHQFLYPGVDVVHHLDEDGLNNRRANLQPMHRAAHSSYHRRLILGYFKV
jgi:hypothetical protein